MVAQLRKRVATLPFDSVSEILEWNPPDGKYAFKRANGDEKGRAFKPGDTYVSRRTENGQSELVPVPATHSTCFFANIKGSETATFGLTSYPPVMVHRETVVTKNAQTVTELRWR